MRFIGLRYTEAQPYQERRGGHIMYKKILCPVDGSETSNCGVQEAMSLAKEQDAELRFFHVIDTYVPIVPIADGLGGLPRINMSEILQKNAEAVISEASHEAKKNGVEAETKITEILGGSTAEEIVREAQEWAADIIVMGTHGLRGFDRLVMGSGAENVVRTSPIPVMLLNAAKMKKDN